MATGLHILTRGLAVNYQDVGHLSKLNTGRVLLNFFQEFSKDHFTPANERRRRDTVYASQGPLLLWVGHPEGNGLGTCQMNGFQRLGVDELLLSSSWWETHKSGRKEGTSFCCHLSAGVGYMCALRGPGRWQLPAPPSTHIFRISLPLSPRIWKSPSRISGK